MTKRTWLLHRLRAMNFTEIAWRIQQKMLCKWEYAAFYIKNRPVWAFAESRNGRRNEALFLLPAIAEDDFLHSCFKEMALPGNFSYSEYQKKWNAGYQTENTWPEAPFSADIPIASREEIGDIRTNWELNRHLQFPCLAKNYYLTGNPEDLKKLEDLFRDWNCHNPFLHGVEWKSPMEMAIRTINWIVTAVFLEKAAGEKGFSVDTNFIKELEQGVQVMAESVRRHRSRGSSANNHLIVELSAVGIAGVYLQKEAWIALAVKELTSELSGQFFADGINREMSLHYQAFSMEAYGLFGLSLMHSGRAIPRSWQTRLDPASGFLRNCLGAYGEALDFGDNDEGRILDLTGKRKDYYIYVLQLMSILLNRRYTKAQLCETVSWLTEREEKKHYEELEYCSPSQVEIYPEGGYTILRSADRKLLLGFDHGALGYGPLAAHGHADALSIQVFYEGRPLLADPGTGSYHVPKDLRIPMRSTQNHNTVKVEGMEQAEMLGPFLWGKRYQLLETETEQNQDGIILRAGITYEGAEHHRTLRYDFGGRIQVDDVVTGTERRAWQCWCLPEDTGLPALAFETDALDSVREKMPYSVAYNSQTQAESLRFCLKDGKIRTVITVKK